MLKIADIEPTIDEYLTRNEYEFSKSRYDSGQLKSRYVEKLIYIIRDKVDDTASPSRIALTDSWIDRGGVYSDSKEIGITAIYNNTPYEVIHIKTELDKFLTLYIVNVATRIKKTPDEIRERTCKRKIDFKY